MAQNRYIDLAQDCTFFSRPPPVCHGFPRLLLEIWSIVSVGVGTSSVGECERRAPFDESFTPRCNGEDSFRQRTRAPRAGSFEPPSTQAAANARPTSAVYVLSHLAQPRRETSVGFMSSVVAARKLLRLCTCRWRGEDRERAGQDAPLKPLTSAPPPTHNELTVRLI